MVQSADILDAVDELGDDCTAREVADLLAVSLPVAALGLLRAYRNGLVERCRLCKPHAGQTVFAYSLTEKGEHRLDWLMRRT